MQATAPERERFLPGLATAAVVLVAVEHVLAVCRAPLPWYGGGAEYIEHLRRARAWAWLSDQPLTSASTWQGLLAQLDSTEFPPGIVLTQLPVDLVTGPGPLSALVCNLAWLGLWVVATVGLGRALGLGRTAGWAGVLLLLSPAAWGAARSWYYDLPLAALLTASLWAWAELIRRPRATAFLAACVLPALAELTKWEAVLFAAPLFVAILPVAWVLPDPRGEAPDRALRLRRLGALLGSLCLAVGSVTLAVQGLRGSFGSRLGGLLNVNPESSREGGSILSSLLARLGQLDADSLGFFPRTLWETSLGWVLCAALIVALLRLPHWPRALAWLVPAGVLGCWIAVLAVSDIREARFAHPTLALLALASAAGLASLPERARPTHVLVAVVGLLALQLLVFDWSSWRPAPGLVPAEPTGQIGWTRPDRAVQVDARAVRETLEALEAATPETTRYALHPLNYSIGRSPWVWDYWAAVDGRDLLRVDLPAWSGCPQPPGSESVAEQASRIDALATDLPHSALSDPSVFCGLHPCSPDAGWEGIDPCRSLRPWAELQLLELGEAQSVRPDSPDHQVTLRAWKRESGP